MFLRHPEVTKKILMVFLQFFIIIRYKIHHAIASGSRTGYPIHFFTSFSFGASIREHTSLLTLRTLSMATLKYMQPSSCQCAASYCCNFYLRQFVIVTIFSYEISQLNLRDPQNHDSLCSIRLPVSLNACGLF